MRQWTQAERDRQAQLIKQSRPWEKSTGPRSLKGKEKSKMNAYKDGTYTIEGKQELKLARNLIKMAHALYKKPRRI